MYDSDQVNDYSKKELAEKIFNGEVSREQVNEDGLFRPHRPMLDEELGLMKQEELDWTNATAQNTVESYQAFLDKYNPTIVQGESITDGWVDNTVYIGRHVEDARRLQAVVKKNDDVAIETEKDKAAWVKAKNADTIESYIEYISTFDRQLPLYRGQYVDEAKLKINQLQDELDWEKAKSLDTIDSYKSYLDKYGSSSSLYQGTYISDAKKAIELLTPKTEPDPLINETEDWAKAVRADNLEAYNNYLAKYELIGGKYVAQAKNAIERLLEEKAWSDALESGKIAGYKKYISLYGDKKGKYLAEAKLRLNQLEDDLAWMAATEEDNLSVYRDYLSKYDVLAPKYRGRHIEDAKNRIAHIDDIEWTKATKTNTLTAYRLYVSEFDGNHAVQKGKHLEEAKIRINRIMDDDCWANAVKQNTKDAYHNYLQKYPQGSHVSEAQKKIQPSVPPTPWFRYVMVLFIAAACVFLGWQYWNKDWPFSQERNEKHDIDCHVKNAAVDSLQWAIENHNIPMLTRYAEMDSIRAYYPLALDFWEQQKDTLNSLIYIREALHSVKSGDSSYSNMTDHLNVIKKALDYDNTIGHVAPPLSPNIEDRLLTLSKEMRIINRAKVIADKYSFEYTPNKEILRYIEDDFNRWVMAGDNSPVAATKEDCYKSALQLKEDSVVRAKLNKLYK